ncbi:caspase family protein [Bradyrhizobium sediminis]|uniref:Caspase family protein n=1 Tax=Bradyrhizobium sediminis TaxID=2840469 RepID=A0A975NNQ3_9BRAD|nr:caspase family protein [Bradyrhizobium sediminis]QWG18215.1 caspase family protein [Bradyrhizobium sediminis]
MNSPGYSRLRRFFLAAALLLVCQPAFAEKRVALVLGNSAYQNAARLTNPINDGATIAATLKAAGFDVVDSRHDLPAAETRRALRDFADRARDSDIAVVYYAGHGLEVDGTNYLIPVDAKLERDTDVFDEALSLDRVLVAIEPAKRLRLVILDACRDNPFSRNMKRTVASRAIGQGLAKIEPTSPNMLIAYSAKAGSTAADGDGKNSPFTMALAKHLTTPGLDVRRAFGFIRDDVLKNTSNRQEPFVYGSLGGEDVPLVPAKPVAAPAAAPNPQAEARRDYELALQIGNKDALNAFLVQYPEGFYASLARIQLAKFAAEEARVAATEKARLAEQERARLAAEGAQKTQQVKAEADAKAAEQARIAAEKAKQVAQEQAAEAERNRAATEKTAGTPPAAEKAQSDKGTNLASLNTGPSPADLTKSVQAELRRVGCLAAAADGDWNAASQRSMALFNRYARTKFDVKLASLDALDAIKLKPSRVCPLVCEHGFKADGDRCSKIACAEGSFLNDDNECEKRRANKPAARRDDAARPPREAPRPEASAAKPRSSSGQIVCDSVGCRPVKSGCHIEFRTTAQGGPYEGGGGNVQICR